MQRGAGCCERRAAVMHHIRRGRQTVARAEHRGEGPAGAHDRIRLHQPAMDERRLPAELGRHRAPAHRIPPGRDAAMRDDDERHRERNVGSERGLVEMDDVHPPLAREPGNGEASRPHRRRIGRQPVECLPGIHERHAILGQDRLALRVRWRRPEQREDRFVPQAGECRRQFSRILPDAADRIDGHQDTARPAHAAASVGAAIARSSPRASASQRARRSTPTRQPILPPSPSASSAARVSATK